ncbi:MAG: hypothetical protein HZA23_04990, partial [Nitrospirae bacterium]|nr:hypothetical protein [Nitrospirota bacterium]
MNESKKGSGRLNPFKNTAKKLSDQLSPGKLKQAEDYELEIEELQHQIRLLEEEAFQLRQSRRHLDQAYH